MNDDRHLVAALQERLRTADLSDRASGERRVVAYYGLKSRDEAEAQRPSAQSDIEAVTVANVAWKVEWRDTSRINQSFNCGRAPCPHQSPSTNEEGAFDRIPFWRGSGDDPVIQHAVQSCCPARPETSVMRDPFGWASYSNFRAAIFSMGGHDADDAPSHSFVLAPMVPHEGDELGKRIGQTLLLIRFLSRAGLSRIRVCILKGARASWRKHSTEADAISRQAEILRSNVESRLDAIRKQSDAAFGGVAVEFVPGREQDSDRELDFEFERAVRTADLIIPFDGSTGNIVARSLAFLNSEVELFALPWFVADTSWPVGEGAFVGYNRWQRSSIPIERAVMWKVLDGAAK